MATATLSHEELLALRSMALHDLENAANEAACFPEDSRLRSDMVGAALAFGALNRREHEFHPYGGPGEESLEIEFTDEAWRWLAELRDSLRDMLDGQRRSPEISESSRRDVFVLFVLDGFDWEQAACEAVAV